MKHSPRESLDLIINIAGTQNSSESPSSTRILYPPVAFCLSKKISGGWGGGRYAPESSQKVRDDIYKNPFFPLHFTTLLTVFLFNQILFTASHPILGVAKAINSLSFLYCACFRLFLSLARPGEPESSLVGFLTSRKLHSVPSNGTSQLLWPFLLLLPFPMTFPDPRDSLYRLAVLCPAEICGLDSPALKS